MIGTPLLVDANGNGLPDLRDTSWLPDATVLPEATVEFDLDADGRTETIEWLKPYADALLGVDVNGNGILDDGSELFGTTSHRSQGYAHGFESLARLDKDQDGKVSGEELRPVLLWFDDGDGKCEAGELVSAQTYGIESLSTHQNMRRGTGQTTNGPIALWDWYTEELQPARPE